MRVESFTVDSFVHVVKRGGRGMDITKNKSDQWRFVRLLFYMNNEFADENWERRTKKQGMFSWPVDLPTRRPLVKILAYCLMPNHFHLILKEIKDGGVSLFMKKLGESMTRYFNEKYQEKGSIFQGAYKSRTIDSDEYLRYVGAYVMAKNTFELYPKGGLEGAMKNFDDAWKWATDYPFCSLADYSGGREYSVILDKDLLGEIFASAKKFKDFCQNCKFTDVRHPSNLRIDIGLV
ncbi:MAG: transposase [Patescibacteria group bacterium]